MGIFYPMNDFNTFFVFSFFFNNENDVMTFVKPTIKVLYK